MLIRKNGEDPRLIKLGPKYVKVECTRAIVVLPEEDLKNAPKSVMYWFAYTTAKINPFLTQTVEEIFSQPAINKKVCCSSSRMLISVVHHAYPFVMLK